MADSRTSKTYFTHRGSWWEAAFEAGPSASVKKLDDVKDVLQTAGSLDKDVMLVYVKSDMLAQEEVFELPDPLKVGDSLSQISLAYANVLHFRPSSTGTTPVSGRSSSEMHSPATSTREISSTIPGRSLSTLRPTTSIQSMTRFNLLAMIDSLLPQTPLGLDGVVAEVVVSIINHNSSSCRKIGWTSTVSLDSKDP